MNHQYLEKIRSNTCYPAFRGFVTVFTLLGYLVAVFVAIGGFITGQVGAMFIAIAGGALLALLIHVAKEMSLMLADIADATIESCSKSDAVVSQTEVPSQSAIASPVEDDATVMDRYGITFDGEHYHYQTYRYEKLSDAISYARRQSTQS